MSCGPRFDRSARHDSREPHLCGSCGSGQWTTISTTEDLIMSEKINSDRRHFLRLAAVTAAAQGLGAVGVEGLQSARATTFGELRRVDAGVLSIGYADVGPASGSPVVLLHGWPYDIHSFAAVARLLAADGYRVLVPYLRGYGTTRFLSQETPRNGQQAALAADCVAFMDALKIDRAIIAGFDWGARTANIVAALWPQRCKAMVSVSGYLIGSREANRQPLPPRAEFDWWYQYYFATERGRAGYDQNRSQFAKLIWQTASPRWRFDDETFERTARAFDNPDHVSIVIHNYRWRLGLADGESKFDDLERQLAAGPLIGVPTITLEGDANGAPHPDPAAYAKKFSGKYRHQLLTGGIGHNPPQEAPRSFADAVIAADRL
jgi:pimeloyl-ACP methyl ester carboxylesterase